jgi:hypothetical protein
VDDVCAWACYYADFPVVRIRDGAVTGWHHDIKGACALAVASSRVALFGGYGPDHVRLALAELGADRAQPASQYRVVLPGGEPLPAGTQVIGRGSRLHFLTGTTGGSIHPRRLLTRQTPAKSSPSILVLVAIPTSRLGWICPRSGGGVRVLVPRSSPGRSVNHAGW